MVELLFIPLSKKSLLTTYKVPEIRYPGEYSGEENKMLSRNKMYRLLANLFTLQGSV